MSGGATRLDDLELDLLPGLLPDLEDLAHDLGKYVCFETGFVGLDAPEPELRAALRSDLLATRRQGQSTETAWQVWARLRPTGLDGDADLRAIDAAVARLERADLDGDRDALLAAAEAARQVRAACRRLVQRTRDRLDAAGRLEDLV